MTKKESISSRERVRLALEHQETDRIPIAMVCAGINPTAFQAFDAHLKRERGIAAETYLRSFIDIRDVGPGYIGPKRRPGEDLWGVRRKEMSYGPGSYDEIETYPLAGIQTMDELASYPWPETAWFDYPALVENIAAAQRDGEHCLMISNGNIFETSWYLRGFEQSLVDRVMKAVGGLIDMGIDVLQALQFSARGMDPGVLKEKYGEQLCFEGGVSVQTTLPFGTPEEVRQEVEARIAVLGKGGGYLLGPSHAIQAGTPPENILAMFDTALQYYPFR